VVVRQRVLPFLDQVVVRLAPVRRGGAGVPHDEVLVSLPRARRPGEHHSEDKDNGRPQERKHDCSFAPLEVRAVGRFPGTKQAETISANDGGSEPASSCCFGPAGFAQSAREVTLLSHHRTKKSRRAGKPLRYSATSAYSS